jgi:hypothetical protein
MKTKERASGLRCRLNYFKNCKVCRFRRKSDKSEEQQAIAYDIVNRLSISLHRLNVIANEAQPQAQRRKKGDGSNLTVIKRSELGFKGSYHLFQNA